MKDATLLVHAGRDPEAQHGMLNPPVYHGSTVTFPTMHDFSNRMSRLYDGVWYGLYGTPTTQAFEAAVAAIEGGRHSIALSSGLAALGFVNLSLLKSGDHVLVADAVYGPLRELCDDVLTRFGISTTYYDPLIGGGIADLIRPNTRLIWAESPGTTTLEVQDIPAIAAAARARGVLLALDNTAATPLFFKPFRHGVDISVQAATKYIGGHSDLLLGVVTVADRPLYERLKRHQVYFGQGAAPDDCFLALRGLSSMEARLRRHEESALRVARWLLGRPEVKRVLHPALPGHPGHEVWRRDFTGSNGLLSIVLRDGPREAAAAMVDGLTLFHIGASWGGAHSLITPVDPSGSRTATRWTETGQMLRLHIGLEDPDDLIADLEAGFARLVAHGG